MTPLLSRVHVLGPHGRDMAASAPGIAGKKEGKGQRQHVLPPICSLCKEVNTFPGTALTHFPLCLIGDTWSLWTAE